MVLRIFRQCKSVLAEQNQLSEHLSRGHSEWNNFYNRLTFMHFICVQICVYRVPTVDSVFSVEVGGNETQFTLRELQPNQAYRLRIAAGTGVGFGVPSEWAQHQTLAHYNHSDHSIGKEDTRPGSLSIC